MSEQPKEVPTAVWLGGFVVVAALWAGCSSSGPPRGAVGPTYRPAAVQYVGGRPSTAAADAEIDRATRAAEARVRREQEAWEQERRKQDEEAERRRRGMWR